MALSIQPYRFRGHDRRICHPLLRRVCDEDKTLPHPLAPSRPFRVQPWALPPTLRFRLWLRSTRNSRLFFSCSALVFPILLCEERGIALMTGTLEMILVDGGILSGVIAAFILSLRMMITAKTRKSLQFQLAAWLVIWTVSMLAFAAFISIRFSKFIRR